LRVLFDIGLDTGCAVPHIHRKHRLCTE
jgi:hypothetical protein